MAKKKPEPRKPLYPWIVVNLTAPKGGELVETMIWNGKTAVNRMALRLINGKWFLEDALTAVDWRPTHWRPYQEMRNDKRGAWK